MLNLSNVLSLSRAGFALVFLQDNPLIRLAAIGLAMLSDFLDGYLARRQRTTSHFGAILDPIMDKFFVFFVGGVFYLEGKLSTWQLGTLLSRDISLCLFGIYLWIVKGWKGYECKAIWWGKITTVAQFIVLTGLTINIHFPVFVYLLFVLMAAFAFLELLLNYGRNYSA
ncbi:MAG: CDP-alcohol phosphatidyltransferase family protein [Chlamydiales bacterium]